MTDRDKVTIIIEDLLKYQTEKDKVKTIDWIIKFANQKKQGQSLPIDNVSLRSKLLAFAKEMQNIGFNEIDNPEKVVDIYIKANCG